MPSLIFDIALPAARVLALYRGQANRIRVRSRDGRWVDLPAHHLKPYLTREGIYGSFRLAFDEQGRLLSLEPLASSGPGGLQV